MVCDSLSRLVLSVLLDCMLHEGLMLLSLSLLLAVLALLLLLLLLLVGTKNPLLLIVMLFSL